MNGKNQRLLTDILSELYKSSPGLSKIGTIFLAEAFGLNATGVAEYSGCYQSDA